MRTTGYILAAMHFLMLVVWAYVLLKGDLTFWPDWIAGAFIALMFVGGFTTLFSARRWQP